LLDDELLLSLLELRIVDAHTVLDRDTERALFVLDVAVQRDGVPPLGTRELEASETHARLHVIRCSDRVLQLVARFDTCAAATRRRYDLQVSGDGFDTLGGIPIVRQIRV